MCPDDWTTPNRAWTHPVSKSALISGPLCPRYQRATMTGIFPAQHRCRKPRPTKTLRLARLRAPPERGCLSIARKTVPASPTDHLGRVYRCNPTSDAASASHITHLQLMCGPPFGRELGTNWEQCWQRLAPCHGHNAKTAKVATCEAYRIHRTLSTTATCFQRHADGRRAGLKIRSSQGCQTPTFCGASDTRLMRAGNDQRPWFCAERASRE